MGWRAGTDPNCSGHPNGRGGAPGCPVKGLLPAPPDPVLLSLSPRMSACTAQNQELQRKVLHLEKQNS